MIELNLKRRQVFQGLLAISAMGGLAACDTTERVSEAPAEPVPEGYFTPPEMALLAAIAQTLIPRTETAGAVEAGVPATLQELATDWGDDAFRTYWRTGLQALEISLQSNSGKSFAKLSSEAQTDLLSEYDAAVFAETQIDPFYRDLKRTIVQAYYTSEPGASEELAYEPVPGEWIGCVPLSEFPKAWAT